MHSRASSDAAGCGQSPVASVGQRATLRLKPTQREARHQSELLDEALDESFPASDPASPFVAARGHPPELLK